MVNIQLHRFTRRDNTAISFRGATFLTHTVHTSLSGETTQLNDNEVEEEKDFIQATKYAARELIYSAAM